ncbi:NAD(P)H:quinone oxidoreductase [Krasilnikovia sp. M28-CT-15]|uniref:NAD(P)H:quinone oxidoreductase n=1 Tax=Krasilnikovia sp. M28-CT-15 TaxID=3373540 RepID=UPI003877539F
MTNVAVIYYSSTGNVHQLARAAAEEAEKAGAEVRLRRVAELASEEVIATNPAWAEHRTATVDVEEATLADLEWADAILFGTPTRFGLPAAQLKQFIDATGGLWFQGKLVNKVVSSFTSTSQTHGGQESTLLALNNTFYHWGAIIVPPGWADPVQFSEHNGNPYGVSGVSKNQPSAVHEDNLAAVAFQARRTVEIADALKRGLQQS